MSPMGKVTTQLKKGMNKDTAGASGAGVGVGFFVVWHADIRILLETLLEHIGLTGQALVSATDITTDVLIIAGTFVASYVASKFAKS